MPEEIVSFVDEPLILVDAEDREIGTASKEACHDGDGVLHRAFSVFLFNDDGALLLQQRSMQKPLWPGYWANSCCSHPRRGEVLGVAAHRRVGEELGVSSSLTHVYAFEYKAPYLFLGTEHEFCHVFVGALAGEPEVNTTEVQAFDLVSPESLDRAIADNPEIYSPWLKLEWHQLRSVYWDKVLQAVNISARESSQGRSSAV